MLFKIWGRLPGPIKAGGVFLLGRVAGGLARFSSWRARPTFAFAARRASLERQRRLRTPVARPERYIGSAAMPKAASGAPNSSAPWRNLRCAGE
jgi:hypothetical protein